MAGDIDEPNMMPDHVHPLVDSDPTLCVAEIVNGRKGWASRTLRRELNSGHRIPAARPTAHPRISALFRKFQHEGFAPCVALVPGMTPGAWIAVIETRFSNPAIQDATHRVAFDGPIRHTGLVLPILRGTLAAGGSVAGLRPSGRACARARARTEPSSSRTTRAGPA